MTRTVQTQTEDASEANTDHTAELARDLATQAAYEAGYADAFRVLPAPDPATRVDHLAPPVLPEPVNVVPPVDERWHEEYEKTVAVIGAPRVGRRYRARHRKVHLA